MDIIICRVKYGNSKSKETKVHQHFIRFIDENCVLMYPLFSVLGKEKRIYRNGILNSKIFMITGDDIKKCSLSVPTFIDCGIAFRMRYTSKFHFEKLSPRELPEGIKNKLLDKIISIENNGNSIEIPINRQIFLAKNIRCLDTN